MQKILILFVLVLGLSCKTNQKSVSKENPECNTIGTVKDFKGLDGCTYLIVLENGDKLNPIDLPTQGFEWKDGQKVRFGYEIAKDMMSVCMSEKAIVKLTCIEILGDAELCVDTKNPFEIEWMNKVIDRKNPNQILKYKNGDSWMYFFKSIPNSYLYDCKGNYLCESTGKVSEECHTKYLNSLGKGKVIWQGEGIWD